MGLGDGDQVADVLGFGADPRFADRDVHVGGVFLQQLHRPQGCEVLHALGFEGVAVVAF